VVSLKGRNFPSGRVLVTSKRGGYFNDRVEGGREILLHWEKGKNFQNLRRRKKKTTPIPYSWGCPEDLSPIVKSG